VTYQIIPTADLNPASAPVRWDRPEALDDEWCAGRASEVLKYPAANYPECAGSEALHPHQEAAHAAAVAGVEARYLEALWGYMRAGRDGALRIRESAA
jgi:hypothetical protein